jgi:hypothetical protein
MFKTYFRENIPGFVAERECYPVSLPPGMEDTLIGIEALLIYGHVKHALDHALECLHDSPNGMASDSSYEANTFKLFNLKVHKAFKGQSEYAIKLLRKMIADKEAEWTRLAIFSLLSVIEGSEEYVGSPWMDPSIDPDKALDLMLQF